MEVSPPIIWTSDLTPTRRCVVVLFDPLTNSQSHVVSPERKTVSCVAFSQDGKYLAYGEVCASCIKY